MNMTLLQSVTVSMKSKTSEGRVRRAHAAPLMIACAQRTLQRLWLNRFLGVTNGD